MELLDIIAKGIVSANDVGIPKVNANQNTIQGIINAILMLAGAVAVVFIVLGGLKYTISQGDSSNLQKAKDTILYAVVGLVVVMFAFVIVNFVVGKF